MNEEEFYAKRQLLYKFPDNTYLKALFFPYPVPEHNPFFIDHHRIALPVVNFTPNGSSDILQLSEGDVQETAIRLALNLNADTKKIEVELKLCIDALKGK